MIARNMSLDMLAERNLANAVSCHHCGQPEGETCVTRDLDGSTHELANFPAHTKRITEARVVAAVACDMCAAAAGDPCTNLTGKPIGPHPTRKQAHAEETR